MQETNYLDLEGMPKELNKELCGLLGICWHDDSLEVGGVAVGFCRKCGAFNPVKNPDFISDPVALLREMRKRKDYLLDDTGRLAIEARDFLKGQKC